MPAYAHAQRSVFASLRLCCLSLLFFCTLTFISSSILLLCYVDSFPLSILFFVFVRFPFKFCRKHNTFWISMSSLGFHRPPTNFIRTSLPSHIYIQTPVPLFWRAVPIVQRTLHSALPVHLLYACIFLPRLLVLLRVHLFGRSFASFGPPCASSSACRTSF